MLLYASITLFVFAVVAGVTILVTWLNKKNASRAVVYTHGLLAVSGLLVLVYYAFTHPDQYPRLSVILYGVTALGGIYLFATARPDKAKPIPVAIIHGLLAVVSSATLLFYLFS